MSQTLPPSCDAYDERNQNETRRQVVVRINGLIARVAALEAR